jgi:hypothetical protein
MNIAHATIKGTMKAPRARGIKDEATAARYAVQCSALQLRG